MMRMVARMTSLRSWVFTRQLDSLCHSPDTVFILQPSVSTHDPKRATKVTLKAVLLLSGVLSIVFLVSFTFSEEGIAELRRARGRVESLRVEIQHLEQENARLVREVESINRSTFAVERIARQDLGMAKPGEIIYMLPDGAAEVQNPQVRR